MAFPTAETRSDLIELSVAMLKQAPSAALLEELIALSVGGGTLADAADHIAKTAAFKAEYPSFQTAEQYAAEIFDNITTGGTVTADIRTAVIELATGMLTSGSVTKAGLALAIAEYLAAPAALLNTDFADIAQSFQNRADAAEYFVVTKELGGSTDAELAAAIASVTSDAATLTAANTAADATASAEAVVAGQTFTLTTGLDNGSSFTGGTGDDTFVGVDNNVATTGTLTAGDNLVGGEGTDTLSIVASGTPSEPLISSSSVETLSIANNSEAPYSLDASLMTGLTKLNVTGGNSTTAITNSQGNLDIVASTTNNSITTTSLLPSAGAADEVAISLTAVGRTGSPTILSDGIETFNVSLSGAASGSTIPGLLSTVTLDSNELETVNVTGDVAANLVVVLQGQTAFQQVGTVDASAATGNITINVTPGTSSDKKTAISMGAGDDNLTIGALDKDYTITGGEGTDTLVATAAAPTTGLAAAEYVGVGVSGFEIISASSEGSVDFRSLANNTTFVATTGAGTYSKAGASIADSYLTATSGDLTLTRATDTAADALNVHIQAATAATVTASAVNEETVTIASAGSGTGVTHSLGLTVSDATTLNVIGTNALDITSLTGETSLATIDAGDHTGSAFTVDASGSTAAMTVTGSAGNESAIGATVNNITTGSGADDVTGGEFADTLNTGAGNDSVTGGAGNDDITTLGGNDTVVAGDGDDTVTGGTGDDSISGGAGNDNLDAGSGADTVDGGAGNDRIVITLSDSTSVDGGTGTDRVSASTADITSTTAATVTAQFIAVADSVAPALTGVEQLHVRVDADAGTAVGSPVNLDLSDASSLTSLFMDTDDTNSDGFMKVTNFAGSAVTLYGGANFGSGAEAENIALDGVGQSAVTLNLQAFLGEADDILTVTGIQGLTIAGDSTSQLTGTADQDNRLGVVTANSVTNLTVNSNGSATTNAGALTVASISATAANNITITSGSFDDFEISGNVTAASAVETATVTVGTDSQMTLADLVMTGASALSTTITLNSGAFLSNSNGAPTLAGNKAVDIVATSIADFNVDLAAASNALLDIQGVAMPDADFTIGTSSTLVLGTSLGVAGSASNFNFSGRGDLDDTDDTTIGNEFNLLGTTVVFNTSGLTVDAENLTITTGATTSANITTGLGADTITGGAGNDTLRGNSGADQLAGGDGADSITLTETVSAADVVIVNAVVGTSSDSVSVTVTGNNNNKGEDTITGLTVGTDIVRVVATSAVSFVHGTDTAIGTADAGVAATGVAGDYAITTGLIDLDDDGFFSGVDDVIVNFSSPSAALTETNFEAALQYNLTLAAGNQTVVTGGQADTVVSGAGSDVITGGEGADEITLGTGTDTVVFTGAAITSATAADTVAGFDAGSVAGSVDKISFGSTFLGQAFGSDDVSVEPSNSIASDNSDDIIIVSDNVAGVGVASTFITLMTAWTQSDAQKGVVVVDDGSDAYIYYVDDSLDADATDVTTADVILIGTLSGTDVSGMTAANFTAAI